MKMVHAGAQWATLCSLAFATTWAQAGTDVSPVPEPSIVSLFAAGAVAVALVSKYRKK